MLNRSILIGLVEHKITGRKLTNRGYVTCCIKSHPGAGKDGYVFEHRLVAEQSAGRYLNEKECVHHINGNKSDNRIENLEIMEHAKHTAITHTGLRRNSSTREKISLKAKERFSDKKNHPEYRDIPESEMISFYRKNGAKLTASKYGVTRRVIYKRLHEWGVELNNAQ